jgi:hypothetical protein
MERTLKTNYDFEICGIKVWVAARFDSFKVNIDG